MMYPVKTIWKCELFGLGSKGIIFILSEGQEPPNAFWRLCQYLFLGNKWYYNYE